MNKELVKIPKLEDILAETPQSQDEDRLMVILNQPPKESWIRTHPLNSKVRYLPIEKVEYLLNAIYGGFNVEVKHPPIMLVNSVEVTVRVHVINPITGKQEYHDGVAAWPVQVDEGSNPSDISKIKSNGVQLAVGAAKSDAIKDAAHHFGRIFGRDLNRKDVTAYESLLPKQTTEDELRALYNSKKSLFTPDECKNFERILDNKEATSYEKMKAVLLTR